MLCPGVALPIILHYLALNVVGVYPQIGVHPKTFVDLTVECQDGMRSGGCVCLPGWVNHGLDGWFLLTEALDQTQAAFDAPRVL